MYIYFISFLICFNNINVSYACVCLSNSLLASSGGVLLLFTPSGTHYSVWWSYQCCINKLRTRPWIFHCASAHHADSATLVEMQAPDSGNWIEKKINNLACTQYMLIFACETIHICTNSTINERHPCAQKASGFELNQCRVFLCEGEPLTQDVCHVSSYIINRCDSWHWMTDTVLRLKHQTLCISDREGEHEVQIQ